jgi:8-oxo-dGTP pyrophosphatase MutT (NUDIX family)
MMTRQAARVIIVKDKQMLVMSRNKFGHKYYALIGGGIDPGETPEQTLVREVREETTLNVADPRLVYIEEADKPFGRQYIYWCAFPGGEVKLTADAPEAKINELKQNLYEPMWLDIDQLPKVPFLSTELKDHLIKDLAHGFGSQPVTFSSGAVYETNQEIERRSDG